MLLYPTIALLLAGVFTTGPLPVQAAYPQDSICAGFDDSQCQAVTTLTSLQSISQRDVAANLTIMDAIFLNFDMTPTLFQPKGYTRESVAQVGQVLYLGYKSLHIDLYWNENGRYWQLCPFMLGSEGTTKTTTANDTDGVLETDEQTLNGVTCSNVGLQDLLDQIYGYIAATPSDFVMSVLHCYLRLHSLGTPLSTDTQSQPKAQQAELSSLMYNTFGSALYTPMDLMHDRESGHTYAQSSQILDLDKGFPLSSRFLFEENKRIFISAENYTLRADTSYPGSFLDNDKDRLFVRLDPESNETDVNRATGGVSYIERAVVYTNSTDEPACLSLSSSDFIGNLTEMATSSAYAFDDPDAIAPSGVGNKWVFIADSDDAPFTQSSIASYITCGYLPVVSSPLAAQNLSNLVTLANSAIWSWAPDQPAPLDTPVWEPTLQSVDNNHDTRLYRCAVLDEAGWRVSNCYNKFPTLCRLVLPTQYATLTDSNDNNDDDDGAEVMDQTLLYTWVFGANSSYFDAPASCPPSHTVTTTLANGTTITAEYPVEFGVPSSALQDTSVRIQLAAANGIVSSDSGNTDSGSSNGNGTIPYPIWIDLNSLQISDCWVVGGPDAKCPYNPSRWNRNKVALLSIAVTITFFLLVLIAFLQTGMIPVRHNEKGFRKLINKFTESQYEGVPA